MAARSRSSAASSPTASSDFRRSDMDLELSDEQIWLPESVETLLSRHLVGPAGAWGRDPLARGNLWSELVEFGALSVGDDSLGAIELCLIARALGKHLAVAPFIGSAATRGAAAPFADSLPPAFPALSETDASVALALVDQPGEDFRPD